MLFERIVYTHYMEAQLKQFGIRRREQKRVKDGFSVESGGCGRECERRKKEYRGQ